MADFAGYSDGHGPSCRYHISSPWRRRWLPARSDLFGALSSSHVCARRSYYSLCHRAIRCRAVHLFGHYSAIHQHTHRPRMGLGIFRRRRWNTRRLVRCKDPAICPGAFVEIHVGRDYRHCRRALYRRVFSRTAFQDHKKLAQKRLLYRLWIATPKSFRLPSSWGEYFGSIEPGTIRGGIRGQKYDETCKAFEKVQAKCSGMPEP